jgi:hypothetical protein
MNRLMASYAVAEPNPHEAHGPQVVELTGLKPAAFFPTIPPH